VPIDLADLVLPAHTAVLFQECQRGVLGDDSGLPELASAALQAHLVEHIDRLATAARRAGVAVVHCVVARRPDDRGSNRNSRLFAAASRSPRPLVVGSRSAEVAEGIGVDPVDIFVSRVQGLSPMSVTELDPVLRNLGCTTVVVAGVSLNVAVPNLCFEAVNRGYQCVVPRDAVVGVPIAYGEAVIEHSLAYVATLTDTAHLEAAWQ